MHLRGLGRKKGENNKIRPLLLGLCKKDIGAGVQGRVLVFSPGTCEKGLHCLERIFKYFKNTKKMLVCILLFPSFSDTKQCQ